MKHKAVKGTVVSVTEHYIVLLCLDGTFKNVPRKKVSDFPLLGEMYTYEEPRRTTDWFKYTSVASVFIVAFISSLLFMVDRAPAFVITIDINPSIELFTDKNQNVVNVNAQNSSAEQLLLGLDSDLIKQPLNIAIQKIVKASMEAGYLDSNEGYVVTSIVSLNKKHDQVTEIVEASVSNVLATIDYEYVVETIEKSLYEEANQNQLSVNHIMQAKKLEETGQEFDIEEIRGKTLAELRRIERKNIEKQEQKEKSQPTRGDQPELKTNNQRNGNQSNQPNNERDRENKPAIPSEDKRIENDRNNSSKENRSEQSKEKQLTQPNNQIDKVKERKNNQPLNNSNSGLQEKNQEKERKNQKSNYDNSRKSRP